jgi:hypothetical protein
VLGIDRKRQCYTQTTPDGGGGAFTYKTMNVTKPDKGALLLAYFHLLSQSDKAALLAVASAMCKKPALARSLRKQAHATH